MYMYMYMYMYKILYIHINACIIYLNRYYVPPTDDGILIASCWLSVEWKTSLGSNDFIRPHCLTDRSCFHLRSCDKAFNEFSPRDHT